MLYKAIWKACAKYHRSFYGPRYDSTLENLCVWDRKEPPDTEQVDSIRSFVNSWGTRMQATTCELHSTLEETWGKLRKLESQTILDVDLSDDKIRALIGSCFDKVAKSNAKKRNEATGASKTLHMINPDLFLMWDASIIRGYGGHFKVLPYADFLRRMQRLANYAICQIEKECGVSRGEAIARLKCDGHTIAKALDEYNYVKFTLNDDAVWQAEYQPCNSS